MLVKQHCGILFLNESKHSNLFTHLFLFSNCFILVNLRNTGGMAGTCPKQDASPYTLIHT